VLAVKRHGGYAAASLKHRRSDGPSRTRARTDEAGALCLLVKRRGGWAAASGLAGPPGFAPGPTRLELVVLLLHHGPVKPTTRVERASPGWRPGALPAELRRHGTPGRSRTGDLRPRKTALVPLSYGRMEPPAGVEPAPRPYKGRVLAVDTTEARVRPRNRLSLAARRFARLARRASNTLLRGLMETAGVEPAPPRCKRGALPSRASSPCCPLPEKQVSRAAREPKVPLPLLPEGVLQSGLRPAQVRTGGVEPPQPEAAGLQPAELACAQRPREEHGVAGRDRTGTVRGHGPECCLLHHGHHDGGDDRTRTGDLRPDKPALCAAELRPRGVSK
jgi:hypothetical protein